MVSSGMIFFIIKVDNVFGCDILLCCEVVVR